VATGDVLCIKKSAQWRIISYWLPNGGAVFYLDKKKLTGLAQFRK